jgi:hypothetical protein
VRLLRVSFSPYSVRLSPGEDLQHVFPDVDRSRAAVLLREVVYAVTGYFPSMDHRTDTVSVDLGHVTGDTARRIREEYERALREEQQRLSGLAAVLGDPRQPQQEPEERELEPEPVEVLPWPPDPQEEAERLRQEVEALLRRRSGGGGQP